MNVKLDKIIIRNHPIAPRRGNEPPAQGNALGKERRNNRLKGQKPCFMIRLLPFLGVRCLLYTQGNALG